MKNKYIVITATCLLVIIAGVCYSYTYKDNTGKEIMFSSIDNKDEDEEPTKVEAATDHNLHIIDGSYEEVAKEDETIIYVHLCGAVKNPDVYKAKSDMRLVELIDLAGGLTPEAADDYMNQAIIIEDGQRIYIPTKDELENLSVLDYMTGDNNNPSSDRVNKKVNINTADEAELMSLPGIGQAKAASIVEYRNRNGSFKTIADIMNISGIKEGLFLKIKDLVTVE